MSNVYRIKFEVYNRGIVEPVRKYNIIEAAYHGDLEGIKSAIAEDARSISSKDKFTGSTALHFSAGLGNLSCVEFLLRCHGVDLFALDHDGREPLERALEIGHYVIADLLLNTMFPNNIPDPDGEDEPDPNIIAFRPT